MLNRFRQKSAEQTSTPQRSASVLPEPNQFFKSIEQELRESYDEGEQIAVDLLPSINVATRKRRQPIQQEQVHKTTKPNGKMSSNATADDLIEVDNSTDFNVKSVPTTNERPVVRKWLKNGLLTYDTTEDDSTTILEPIVVQPEIHQIDKSTSIDPTTMPASHSNADRLTTTSACLDGTPLAPRNARTNSASTSIEKRLTKGKHKVGFDTSRMVHEKSTSTSADTASNKHPKVIMKGGKWRRTIVEMRKTKSSQSEFHYVCIMIVSVFFFYLSIYYYFSVARLTLQPENRNSQQSNRRKSVFIKDVRFHMHKNSDLPSRHYSSLFYDCRFPTAIHWKIVHVEDLRSVSGRIQMYAAPESVYLMYIHFQPPRYWMSLLMNRFFCLIRRKYHLQSNHPG